MQSGLLFIVMRDDVALTELDLVGMRRSETVRRGDFGFARGVAMDVSDLDFDSESCGSLRIVVQHDQPAMF